MAYVKLSNVVWNILNCHFLLGDFFIIDTLKKISLFFQSNFHNFTRRFLLQIKKIKNIYPAALVEMKI